MGLSVWGCDCEFRQNNTLKGLWASMFEPEIHLLGSLLGNIYCHWLKY